MATSIGTLLRGPVIRMLRQKQVFAPSQPVRLTLSFTYKSRRPVGMGGIGSSRGRYDFYIRKEVERSPDLRTREYAGVCAYDMLFRPSRDPLTIESRRPRNGHAGVGPPAMRRSLHVHFFPVTRVSFSRPCGKAGAAHRGGHTPFAVSHTAISVRCLPRESCHSPRIWPAIDHTPY